MSLLDSTVAKFMPLIPKAVVKKISTRYIAGESIQDTIACIQRLNRGGCCATVDFLGEVITRKSEALANAAEYIQVIEAIHRHGLDANISIKPSAMGLLLDEAFCHETVASIVEAAAARGIFVRIDMEDVSCTQKEIELLLTLRESYQNVGIVLQAYLKRTYNDAELLIGRGANLRFCKGIYKEDPAVLVQGAGDNRNAINRHFLHHVQSAFKAGTYVAIATHDENLLNQITGLIATLRPAADKYEFQMLLGVCEPLRDKLKAQGHKVRVYVPYGSDWYGYSTRRMKENPQIAGYIFKALMFG
ncbi:proline dehydrogenase [Janthinobacterium sp. CG_23.3]|uniref:proline dehydrogenase family protein n=1 Tax=Janthinobacterium sp. CG_23.3 TaxID=3349634 RepID=UPI0038D4931B